MFVDPCNVGQFIRKNPTRCKNVSKFYYSIFIWSSACFGRHTAHHQEPKTALAAYDFSYVEGCWTCSWWTLSGTVCAWFLPFDMDMSYARRVRTASLTSYPVRCKILHQRTHSHKWRHAPAGMRAHNVLCNSYEYNRITVEINLCSFRSVRFALLYIVTRPKIV
jgi:hypothetical protein